MLKNTNLKSISCEDNTKLCEELNGITRINNGFDDFEGNKLIEPGNPSLSLLYHALASQRAKDPTLKYPSIEQLNVLENFIDGLKKWEDYLKNLNNENIHLMVLAFEYRPAFKTPALGINDFEIRSIKYPKHAQFVFSRAGISRIGNHEINYNNANRSFTNKPADPNYDKDIGQTENRIPPHC